MKANHKITHKLVLFPTVNISLARLTYFPKHVFQSKNQPGEFLLSLDKMLVHTRLPPPFPPPPPQQLVRFPSTLLGGERLCESKVSCPGTQHSDPTRARVQTPSPGVQHTNHWVTTFSRSWILDSLIM